MRFAGILAAVLLLTAQSAFAASMLQFPLLTGRVVDNAHLLTPATAQALEDQLAEQEKKTTNQIVVVTVPSLQGVSIEEFAYKLGRYWGIGQKGKDNGVLLIVAPTEKKVRIEIGYGLEGTMTDALSSQIIQTIILPDFKQGAMEKGVVRGAQAIASVLAGQSIDTAAPASGNAGGGVIIVLAIIIGLISFSQILLALFYAVGSLLGRILSMLGMDGLSRLMARAKAKIYPANRAFVPWLLTPTYRVGGSRGGSSFRGGGGRFGGGGSSGSW